MWRSARLPTLGSRCASPGSADLVAVETELHRADEHLDVPAITAIAHAERDERRELDRADGTDAGPALAIDRIDEAEHELLADAALARLDAEHELDAALRDRTRPARRCAPRRRADRRG